MYFCRLRAFHRLRVKMRWTVRSGQKVPAGREMSGGAIEWLPVVCRLLGGRCSSPG